MHQLTFTPFIIVVGGHIRASFPFHVFFFGQGRLGRSKTDCYCSAVSRFLVVCRCGLNGLFSQAKAFFALNSTKQSSS